LVADRPEVLTFGAAPARGKHEEDGGQDRDGAAHRRKSLLGEAIQSKDKAVEPQRTQRAQR
jgi:hypothetical protein